MVAGVSAGGSGFDDGALAFSAPPLHTTLWENPLGYASFVVNILRFVYAGVTMKKEPESLDFLKALGSRLMIFPVGSTVTQLQVNGVTLFLVAIRGALPPSPVTGGETFRSEVVLDREYRTGCLSNRHFSHSLTSVRAETEGIICMQGQIKDSVGNVYISVHPTPQLSVVDSPPDADRDDAECTDAEGEA